MQVSAALEQALLANIHAIADRLTARFLAAPPHALGLMSGEAGELLFWAHYGRYFDDARTRSAVEARAAQLAAALATGTLHHSYAGGLAGILWALQYLEQNGFIEASFDFSDVDEDIMGFVREQFDAGDCDFLHGGTGLVAYLWHRYRLEPSEQLRKHLAECVARLDASAVPLAGQAVAWRDAFTQTLGAKDELANVREFLNTGLAHGSASIVLLLSQFAAHGIGGAAARRLATAGLTWLQSIEPHDARRLPGQFFDGVPAPSGPIAWCYGGLAHAYTTLSCTKLLALPAQRLHAERYAEELLATVHKRLPDYPELCHGAAGAYVTLQMLARQHAHEAIGPLQQALITRLAALDVDTVTIPPVLQTPGLRDSRDFSLLSGMAGIGLTLLQILDEGQGAHHHWPQCLLLE